MTVTRPTALLLALALGWASHASGQTAPGPIEVAPPDAPADSASAGAREWTFTAVLSIYQVPDDRIYGQPTMMADRDRLHLEARFNYEDIKAGSAWVGYNLGGGEKVAWELTPLFGVVFGSVGAVAPGYRGSVSWRRLNLSSEGEYVFGSKDEEERFFYNWSELTVAPADWWRIGLVTQRTRAYAADRDIQRGILAGFSHRDIDAAIYLLNPDEGAPIVVAAVTLAF